MSDTPADLVPNAAAATEDFEFAALNEARNYRSGLLREFGADLGGRVLEVGAGIGQITTELRARPGVREVVSVEPEPRFCERFRANLPHQRLICGTAADVGDDLRWNAILSVNVLEHIGEDEAELNRYQRLLSGERGALCLFVPARPEIYAPIDRDFGHFRRYTRPELRTKLERAGFRMERLRYFNWVGYFAWWLTFCVLRRRGFDYASVRFFDRVIFPVVHAIESRVMAPPFGQSLLAVARAGGA
jgi:SAM-dependent methyltransferase